VDQCNVFYSFLPFSAEKPHDLHQDMENICEPLLKDSSNEEKLCDSDEEVHNFQESHHNPETEESDCKTEVNRTDVSENEEDTYCRYR
jgi:hypothetical protein